MKRFFFLSLFFHGVLLLFLFSWETPLASKLSTRKPIEVSLIEKIEGSRDPPSGPQGEKAIPGEKGTPSVSSLTKGN
jgi:hypothetical protein